MSHGVARSLLLQLLCASPMLMPPVYKPDWQDMRWWQAKASEGRLHLLDTLALEAAKTVSRPLKTHVVTTLCRSGVASRGKLWVAGTDAVYQHKVHALPD